MLCHAVCVHTGIAQFALCQFNVVADPFHSRQFDVDPTSSHKKTQKCCVGCYKTGLQMSDDNVEQMPHREVSGNNNRISYTRKMKLKITPLYSE